MLRHCVAAPAPDGLLEQRIGLHRNADAVSELLLGPQSLAEPPVLHGAVDGFAPIQRDARSAAASRRADGFTTGQQYHPGTTAVDFLRHHVDVLLRRIAADLGVDGTRGISADPPGH